MIDESCELCDEPATIVVANHGVERRYCVAHTPSDGESTAGGGTIVKWRVSPNDSLLTALRSDWDSDAHQDLWMNCQAGTLSSYMQCQYYLSMVTETDQFSLWSDQFEKNLEDFVCSKTSPEASVFFRTAVGAIVPILGFMRQQFEQSRGLTSKETKRQKAVRLVLEHPDWTDPQIADEVPTTMKQLARNSDFSGLRGLQS